MIILYDGIMTIYSYPCYNKTMSNVETVKSVLAERQKMLANQETFCVGIDPAEPTPPGYFNCHSVVMQLSGQLLLAGAEVQDALRENDKPAQCVAIKKVIGLVDEVRDIATRPGCYATDGPANPIFSPQTTANREKLSEIVRTECGKP